MKHLQVALLNEESNYQVHLLLAKVWLTGFGNTSAAHEHIQKAFDINPLNEHVLFEQGMIYLHLGDELAADSSFIKAEQINAGIDKVLIAKIFMYFRHFISAATWLEKAHDVQCTSVTDSTKCKEILLLLAECYEQRGHNSRAGYFYSKVFKIDPADALAHTAMARIWLGTGSHNYGAPEACGLNQQHAAQHLSSALQSNPTLSTAKSAVDFCIQEKQEVEQWLALTAQFTYWNPLQTLRKLLARAAMRISLAPFTFVCNILRLLLGSTPSPPRPVHFYIARASASDLMRRNWERRSVSMPNSVTVVDIEQYINPQSFGRQFAKTSTPAVLHNVQKCWILSSSQLRYQFGDSTVRVHVSQSGRFDGPENGQLWGLSADAEVLVRPPATSMRLSDFLHLVKQPTSAETFYIEYLALHQYLGPSFERLVMMPLELLEAMPTRHLVTNVWIGGQPTNSPLHYDDYDNLLCQVEGEKEIILFPPSDLSKLYYKGRVKGTLSYAYPGIFTRNTSTIDRRSFVFGSSVNVDRPDIVKHPLYLQATPLRVVLHPGETLFLPAFWHHEVQSLPSAESGLNIAVNFWFANATYPAGF